MHGAIPQGNGAKRIDSSSRGRVRTRSPAPGLEAELSLGAPTVFVLTSFFAVYFRQRGRPYDLPA